MNLYTHLVIASQLQARLKPENLPDYYLGAIVPDIRYYCALPRTQTHITAIQIANFAKRYPHLTSFTMGYAVHCLCDELDLATMTLRRFPLKRLRQRLPSQFAPVLLEFYYLENALLDLCVTEASNELLDALQIEPQSVCSFAQQVNTFLKSPGFSSLSFNEKQTVIVAMAPSLLNLNIEV